jgi:DMSO/TMAO reductase YedYZ molybdopterin-dependent catalytic subunit
MFSGEKLETLPFAGEGDVTFGTIVGQGWDGRLYTDLSLLEANALVTETERFYVRTLYPDLLDPPAIWQIAVDGLVEAPRTLALSELAPLVADRGTHVLECSGNTEAGQFGLLSAARWSGALLSELLGGIALRPEATRVLISGFDQHSVPSANGHSKPGASWIFTFDELARAGAFLATEMNGEPLPPHHGAPVRLYLPGWYGCACIKWVDRITLVDDAAPATEQMKEFAARTHQNGVPELARDYLPATMDQAAMPVRVEKWRVEGRLVYRVLGILWGGARVTDALEIRFGTGAWEPVNVCPPQQANDPWTLWEHRFEPAAAGSYDIALRVNDPSVQQRRLDQGWYVRTVAIDEV